MMISAREARDAELRFVETLRSRFEEEGFRYEAYPDVADLPDFLGAYRPDAIALKGDQKIAIEVKNRQRHADDPSLKWIKQLFDGHADWQFRVIFMGDDPQQAVTISKSTPARLRKRVEETRDLLKQSQQRAAFVIAWSLLEAAFRSLQEAPDGRPYTPGTVIQTLAMNGVITPEVEHELRALINLRNQIVHGDIDLEPTDTQVQLVFTVIENILDNAAR